MRTMAIRESKVHAIWTEFVCLWLLDFGMLDHIIDISPAVAVKVYPYPRSIPSPASSPVHSIPNLILKSFRL